MNVLTQPYKRRSNPAEDHYLTTLVEPYDLLKRVREAGAGDAVNLTAFLRAHPDGRALLWALKNNRTGRTQWPRLTPNDLVLFYGNSYVYAYGRVTAKAFWPGNSHIWPVDSDWDFLYSLRDLAVIPEGSRPRTRDLRTALSNFSAQPAQLHDLAALGTDEEEVVSRLGIDLDAMPVVALPPMPPVQQVPAPTPKLVLPTLGPLGRPATGQDFTGLQQPQNPVSPGWQAIERGTLAHQQVLLQLQQLVEMAGHECYYGVSGCNFDLSWTAASITYICEIKSLTAQNESDQIRLGLGQVLGYRWTARQARPTEALRAVLVTEAEPKDQAWVHICNHVDVTLTWPDRLVADLGL